MSCCLVVVTMYCCCGKWYLVMFFKQETANEMRISDWSSDVCSSDLKLAHRDRAVDEAEVGIRLAEELNKGPGKTVTDQEDAGQESDAGSHPGAIGQDCQHDEQHEAF